METLRRLKKVINWLIFQEVAESEKEVADLLGYTKSSFSQIVNGKVPLSEKFLKKLCALDENINIVWITDGDGEMLLKNNPNSENLVTIPQPVWDVIQRQTESLAVRDRQIDDLVAMLKEQLEQNKKTAARTGDAVISAVAE